MGLFFWEKGGGINEDRGAFMVLGIRLRLRTVGTLLTCKVWQTSLA
jgi:hypothetical protein